MSEGEVMESIKIETPLNLESARLLVDAVYNEGQSEGWRWALLVDLVLAVDAASRKQAQEETEELRRKLAIQEQQTEDRMEEALRLGRERDALRQAQEPLVEALRKAGKQFRLYEAVHLGKGTPEGDTKAVTNRLWAEMCEEALKSAEQSSSVETGK